MNKFDEMKAAVEEAKTTMRAADSVAQAMANMLVGRLRKVGGAVVCMILYDYLYPVAAKGAFR